MLISRKRLPDEWLGVGCCRLYYRSGCVVASVWQEAKMIIENEAIRTVVACGGVALIMIVACLLMAAIMSFISWL